MDRLTKVINSEILVKDGWNKKDTNDYTSICYGCEDSEGCRGKCGFYKALAKLAEYEDIELTPDEIKTQIDVLSDTVTMLSPSIMEIYELKKEREYLKKNSESYIYKLKEEIDYWKKETLKWADKLGQQKIDAERMKQ